jgi:alpha 1,4-N-acetylglucosaminyltransferase
MNASVDQVRGALPSSLQLIAYIVIFITTVMAESDPVSPGQRDIGGLTRSELTQPVRIAGRRIIPNYPTINAGDLALRHSQNWTQKTVRRAVGEAHAFKEPFTETPIQPRAPHRDKKDNAPDEIYHVVLLYDAEIPVGAFCTVESVAKQVQVRPDAEVWVWMNFPDLFPRDLLAKMPSNVKVKLVVFDEAIAGTPLTRLFHALNVELGKYANVNKADALRLALVYKLGGMYLDSDMVVIRDPHRLGYGAALEDPRYFNNAVFAFPRRSAHIAHLMEEYVRDYNGNIWGWQGPKLFTRVFMHKISTSTPCYWDKKQVECKHAVTSVDVWTTASVYPIQWKEHLRLMGQPKEFANETVMVHFWHKGTRGCETNACKEGEQKYEMTLAGSLRKKYCPDSFRNSIKTCSF